MEDPSKGNQPAHMKDFKNLPNDKDNDWGGVHTNSGIINHAAYLIAVGMENPVSQMVKILWQIYFIKQIAITGMKQQTLLNAEMM